jgi:hypothetical protein
VARLRARVPRLLAQSSTRAAEASCVSAHGFTLALAAGSAFLAFWILLRYTNFGPRTIVAAVVHTFVAVVLLRLTPYVLAGIRATGVPGARYVQVFAGALPLFVYAFLSGGWMTRLALGLLRP